MIDGEEKLINDAINGEASAFGLLYDSYHVQIYRFIYLKVSHREEAEDLTHQVFLSAWQNMKSYQHKGFPFSSWLYQIARNKVIDHYRTKKTHIDLEAIQELASTDSALDAEAHIHFEIEEVKKALLELKPEYQDIIIMRFVEELTPSEIAKALNKSESSVRVLQHRAIKSLRKLLNQPEQELIEEYEK